MKNVWWKLDKKLTLEDLRYSAYTAFIECIKNGVTTVFDHNSSPMSISGSLPTISNVADELGIRGCYCYEVSDRDGNIDFIKYAEKKQDDMTKGMFGMHAAFTLSDGTLNKCVKAMEGIDTGYHCCRWPPCPPDSAPPAGRDCPPGNKPWHPLCASQVGYWSERSQGTALWRRHTGHPYKVGTSCRRSPKWEWSVPAQFPPQR